MRLPGSRTLNKIFYPLNRLGIILMYHRVAEGHYDPLRLNVSPQHLQEQMQVLKKYGRPVSLQNFGKNPDSIAVTLDDGYVDNFDHARLIFEKENIPATFFIISGSVGAQNEFFWDGLKRTILAPEILPSSLKMTVGSQDYHWELSPSGPCQRAEYGQSQAIHSKTAALSRFQLYSAILTLMGPLSAQQRQDVIQQLAQWSAQDLTVRKNYLPMSFLQLKTLADHPLFEIGAHTVHHPQLAKLSTEHQEKEIRESKEAIENFLNKPVLSFAYPHGSYNQQTPKILRRLKFKRACTVEPAQVMRTSQAYLLPRFSVEDWDGDEFENNLRQWLARP